MPPRADLQSVQLGAGVYIVGPDGRILLVEQERRGRGHWVALGGGVQPGESVEAAAIREAHEESGLRVRLTRLLAVDQVWLGDALESVIFTFLAEPEGWPQEVVLPERDGNTRFLGWRWFDRADVTALEAIFDDELCRACWPPEIVVPLLRTLRWH